MKAARGLGIAALVGAGIAAAFPAVGQAQDKPDEWQFRATIYGWTPRLDGTTQFPSGAGGPSIDVDAGDLLSKLKMGFMGTLQGQRGQYGFLADWFYADIGDTKTSTRDFSIGGRPLPAGTTANLSLDVKTNILTLAGTYTAIEKPEYQLRMLAGVRMLNIDQTLNYAITGEVGPKPLPSRTGTADVSPTNWDAIVGATGRARFGDGLRWFVPYYVDFGAGNSKFTWQMVLGVGYSFGWGDLVAAWRYTDYEFKSTDALQSLRMQGPALGVSFKF
jgi:hypothetical protein